MTATPSPTNSDMRRRRWPRRRHTDDATSVEGVAQDAQVTQSERRRHAAPRWGWRADGAGRASHVRPIPEAVGTTVQACGMFPFVAGSGAPAQGVPIGRHMLWGEVVCLDPFEWLSEGLVANPGIWVQGQPGTGKSALVKRLMRGLAGFGIRPIVLGDTKPDYTAVVERLGGQVIRVGRGMDRINPLDAGPLGRATHRIGGERGRQLAAEVRGRRLSALMALASLVRSSPILNHEEVMLGRALNLLVDDLGPDVDPTVPDVLRILHAAPDQLRTAVSVAGDAEWRTEARPLINTLTVLVEGALRGVFDGPTTTPIDLDAPAVSVDISSVAAAGDQLVAAAMLSTWGYGFGLVDGQAALADAGLGPRRRYFAVLDELWRALRGAHGLVEHADALTRLNRARGMSHAMITHSLADLEALPSAEDRAKARGFIERCAITVLAGLPPRELKALSEVVRLSDAERQMVASWSASESWQPGGHHSGRGNYLIKTGERVGIPVDTTLVGDEADLYDTDIRMAKIVRS